MSKSRPHADTRLAKFLEKRILELRPRKSQIEIATDAGFINRAPRFLRVFSSTPRRYRFEGGRRPLT
ncbi:hypothetical protein ACEN2R_15490, partial [Pseudogemmobacter sp. W21_MBD1_M6]